MQILIVDDDDIALELLSNTLQEAGHKVESARDGEQALELLRTGLYRMVISDWVMPGLSGVELCRNIRSRHHAGYIYIILVSSRDKPREIVEGLDAGADDFITKPFDPAELSVRVRAGERILSLESRDVTIFALAKLAESRDPETGAHLERMREYCRVIAKHLSQQEKFLDVVDGEYVQSIYVTSPLHDIGKVGIPDSVLLKPGRLTDSEYEIMKAHTTIGAQTLKAAAEEHSDVDFLRMGYDIALTHHEKFDGSGYPKGLMGEEIPLCGRIVALADVYDALTTERIYKAEFSHEVAKFIILEGRDTHFDPDIVDAFLDNEGMFIAIHQGFADNVPVRHQAQPNQNLFSDLLPSNM